jgi:hypothetical protein
MARFSPVYDYGRYYFNPEDGINMFLGNVGNYPPCFMQRLGEHVPAATDMYATIEVVLGTVLSTRSVQRGCKEDS